MLVCGGVSDSTSRASGPHQLAMPAARPCHQAHLSWRQHAELTAQVTTTVLKSGEEITSDIVVVGVGARPNVELLKGQVDLLEEKPGGIKVNTSVHALMRTGLG